MYKKKAILKLSQWHIALFCGLGFAWGGLRLDPSYPKDAPGSAGGIHVGTMALGTCTPLPSLVGPAGLFGALLH